jgi:hypothetical protein
MSNVATTTNISWMVMKIYGLKAEGEVMKEK